MVSTTGLRRSGVLYLSDHLCTFILHKCRNITDKKNKKEDAAIPETLERSDFFRSKKAQPGCDFRPPTVKTDVPSNVPVWRKHLVILPFAWRSLHAAFQP